MNIESVNVTTHRSNGADLRHVVTAQIVVSNKTQTINVPERRGQPGQKGPPGPPGSLNGGEPVVFDGGNF